MRNQFIGSLFFSNTSIDQKQHLIFPIRDCSHTLNVKHEKATSCCTSSNESELTQSKVKS